ncbi:hypothetical protein BSM4216_1450 [Bacillus smithii]|nr:hypothetical protein BSM4216_1450 [Bacillus smithii]
MAYCFTHLLMDAVWERLKKRKASHNGWLFGSFDKTVKP